MLLFFSSSSNHCFRSIIYSSVSSGSLQFVLFLARVLHSFFLFCFVTLVFVVVGVGVGGGGGGAAAATAVALFLSFFRSINICLSIPTLLSLFPRSPSSLLLHSLSTESPSQPQFIHKPSLPCQVLPVTMTTTQFLWGYCLGRAGVK